MTTRTPKTETPPREEQAPDQSAAKVAKSRQPIGQILRELKWWLLLAVGIGGGVSWVFLLMQQNYVQFVAGLLPVAGGILVGRQVKQHIPWHAAFLSLITAASAGITAYIVLATMGNLPPQVQQALASSFLLLIPFPAFGVITASRSDQRAREAREVVERQGGKIERPGRVKTLEDLRALSLNQLAGYVADLFRKHGFLVDDFHFENKDNFVEFALRYEEQPWIMRVTVDEKVKQGAALQLNQYMRSKGISKGVLVTSMDFQDQTTRWARDKQVALIDGPTLLSMND